jgi:hypothetical protein
LTFDFLAEQFEWKGWVRIPENDVPDIDRLCKHLLALFFWERVFESNISGPAYAANFSSLDPLLVSIVLL